MSGQGNHNKAVKAAIEAVESIDNSEYVQGLEAAAKIMKLTRQQVLNLAESGDLTDYGEGGRYGRRRFLRSDCERLANPKNRRPQGRQIGYRKAKV